MVNKRKNKDPNKQEILTKIVEKEMVLLEDKKDPVISYKDPLYKEWIDYKLACPKKISSFFIEIPENYKKKEKEKSIINYLGGVYGINEQNAKIIFQAYDGDISFKKLGELYQEFKEYYNPLEIATILELFKNNIEKARYAIAVNINQDKKEALYTTAIKVNKEKGLDEYAKIVKKLKEEDPIRICDISEMCNGRVSEDGEKFMRYSFREVREEEKRVSRHKGMDLDKALDHAGMHLVEL